MEKHFLIAPSILSADFTRLGEQIAEAEAAGDMLHGWARRLVAPGGALVARAVQNHVVELDAVRAGAVRGGLLGLLQEIEAHRRACAGAGAGALSKSPATMTPSERCSKSWEMPLMPSRSCSCTPWCACTARLRTSIVSGEVSMRCPPGLVRQPGRPPWLAHRARAAAGGSGASVVAAGRWRGCGPWS